MYTIERDTSAPSGVGKRGHLPPPGYVVKCFFVCIRSYSQTLIRHIISCIIFTLFYQRPTFAGRGDLEGVRVVDLVDLACVLRATTKKGRQLFLGKKCTPRENSHGYAYEFAHPWKKILQAPMDTPNIIEDVDTQTERRTVDRHVPPPQKSALCLAVTY